MFSDKPRPRFSGFDLWDIPTQCLEGHFLFIILMSFLCAAQPFKGGKGGGRKNRNKAAPTRNTACTEVSLLGKVTGRGHLVEAYNTTAHFCKPLSREQRDILGLELIIRYYQLHRGKRAPFLRLLSIQLHGLTYRVLKF